MLSMPSRITPACWNSCDVTHMIQPVMPFSRRVSAVAALTAPMLACPPLQSHSAAPTTATITSPLTTAMPAIISVISRASRAKRSRAILIADSANASSRAPWANSFTVWMLE